jgi:hypothetical protein
MLHHFFLAKNETCCITWQIYIVEVYIYVKFSNILVVFVDSSNSSFIDNQILNYLTDKILQKTYPDLYNGTNFC